MELLYLWINRSKNRFIREKGINFSPEFNFIVEKKHDRYILKQDSKWTRETSIFKNDVIENVTAIVGQNGSGKTTLLNYILKSNILPVNEGSYSEGYEELYENNKMDSLCIIIVRENEDKIVIYHNFEADRIENQTSYQKKIKSIYEQPDGFNELLKIFVTNSYYNPQRGITGNSIAFTPSGMEVLAQSFYNKLFGRQPFEDEKKRDYLIWRDAIGKMRNAEDFQRLCDLIYFNHLIEINGFESYNGKISTSIEVGSISPLYIFETMRINDKSNKDLFNNFYNNIRTLLHEFDFEGEKIIRNLIINLIIELCLEKNVDIPENITSYIDVTNWIAKTASNEYYKEGLQEIESLKELTDKAQSPDNMVPSEDMAYNWNKVFDYKKDSDTYKQLLNYINKLFKKEKSFVLRYINIEFPGMSSGERAFQNLFSWINLIPIFSKRFMSNAINLKDEMLIIIDELDLYLHPSWQVKFIRYLLDEVQRQFKGKKIQIIFATHSPLCLSDIPRENTVYLSGKSNDNTFIVDDRKNHTQTFGKDIYSLLNDAFYLENSVMGSFAKKYIDDIITDINKLHDPNNTDRLNNIKELNNKIQYIGKLHDPNNTDRLNNIKELNNKIQYIGNDLLKHKLLNMLPRSLSDKEEKLYALRSQKELIEKQINELEKVYD